MFKKLSSLFSARDMTEGAPWKRLTEFAVPMLLGNLAQQLYNTADSIIVGKYIGDNALAAVGSASPILNLLLALFVGVATGAGIVVSQHYGAKDRRALSLSIGNCITLTAIASVIIMLVGSVVTMPLLKLLGTHDSIIDWCDGYLKIFFWGIAGFFFYNILSGILRGLGDSLSALLFLLISTALNVGLDIWFVAVFKMGVPGVALATIISQAISAVLCLIKLLRMRELFDLNKEMLKLNHECSSTIIRLGIPSGITQGIFAVAMLLVQNLTNSFDDTFIACNVIIMRVDGFAMMPNMTFGQTMTVFTGQNVGARKIDRISKGTRQGTIMAVVFSTVVTIVLLLFGHHLFALFTDTPELIDLAVRMMRILAAGYIAVSITQSLGGVMRGAGDTVTPMWISFFTTVILRVPLAYLIVHLTKSAEYPDGRSEGIFISLLVSWVIGAIVTFFAFQLGNWRKKAMPEI